MTSRPRLLLALGTGVLLGFALALAAVSLARHPARSRPLPPVALRADRAAATGASLVAEVLARVRSNYVDAVDEAGLQRAAARGLVAGLDAHSVLLSQAEFAELQASTRGSYAGIGVEIEGVARGVRVLRTLAGSPAEAAGIRSGDLIERIDALAVSERNLDDALLALHGEPGSLLALQLRRGAGELQRLQLRRSELALASVAATALPGDFAYLRVREFTAATAGEVARALAQLRPATGSALRGLVIDLRDNPGGVLEAASAVADDFLDAGTIVSAEGHASEAHFRIDATPGDLLDGAPIAVLVNARSASAAEILAAALHDNGRAMLVGERTYGKGTVQTILPLSTGEALKLTTSRYYTPAGRSPEGAGLVPDLASAAPAPAEDDAPGPALALRDAGVALALTALRKAHIARGASSRDTHRS
jgi:carboxyl-terminal processing protease